MPVTITHPGVYIEEVPGEVHTAVGVATSVTAFIGRAARGPLDEPITLNNYGDYERIFGGLWGGSSLGFAVRDFFLNGGSQAIVVRLQSNGAAATITLPTADERAPLVLCAASPGSWGNSLDAIVDHATRDPADAMLFNLTLVDGMTGVRERFVNLSVQAGSTRHYPHVLERSSSLVRAVPGEAGHYVNVRPLPTTATATATVAGGTDGAPLTQASFDGPGLRAARKGLYALEKADLFNLLCIPPYRHDSPDVDQKLVASAAAYCEARRAILIVDPPSHWATKDHAKAVSDIGTTSENAVLFFPRLVQPNPLRENQMESFAPCGAVAGVISRTDSQRGVWKAPAGSDALLVGVPALSVSLTDAENGELNPLGINCLRSLPASGRVIWGGWTLQGNDSLISERKYLPVRRLALFIEESLYQSTQWAVFEPNDEPLWAQIRVSLGAFMHGLFRKGAFQGATAREAYFVKCDRETTTRNDINHGIVNISVGFAPLKPAEFVVIRLQQMAGQVQA